MGRTLMHAIQDAAYLTVYHVKGRFGYATDNFFHDGKFIERSTYGHVTQGKLDKVCSAAQTSHQRLMFTYAGVDPQSQDAYELASRGIVRPSSLDTPPILYGVKCIHFNPPDFTLEIHAINEYCEYLAELVNDVGMQLKTTAVCTHIHRIRHGYFELSDALLYRKWNVGDILDNMKQCRRHLTFDKLCTGLDIRERNEEYDGDNDDDDDDNDEFQSEKQFQKIFDSESASLQEMLKEYTKRKELIKKERSEQMSTKSTSENEAHLSYSDINDETNNGVQSSVVK
ncbi:pseudouridylate synthase TRUB2, mitochondrial-like [Mya arenaria]|uniref:pseudouridylate synthase TRUB2, mitochondrial-like n=1 Tax=Mya arenaria TaxID=6604 RepID=UPI0022E4D3A3|nr:pseudouridylate synthase TRUB2, mitochondrial-like [Mya arenaria]